MFARHFLLGFRLHIASAEESFEPRPKSRASFWRFPRAVFWPAFARFLRAHVAIRVANSGAVHMAGKFPLGDTWASRISSTMAGPGQAGRGSLAENTSGGKTTVYIGMETGGGEGTASFTGRSVG